MTQIILPAGSEIESGQAKFSEGNQWIERIATLDDLDMTTAGTYTIFTVPTGKIFIPMYLMMVCTAYTKGSQTDVSYISIGSNDPDYDNCYDRVVIGGQTLPPSDQKTGDTFQRLSPLLNYSSQTVPQVPSFVADDVIKIKIGGECDADVDTWRLELWGRIINA